ncbi:hypothetical protein BEN74_03970 [Acinetobacter sp. WCHAc010034]|uniref:hypothetical protein n=1 Tax=Acinetobacter sp. WCHAc010034 TaxID=1879049 RepID=UPI00083B1F5A|nr:hypothetical protein [Acinetobacter sp. WCHAc010034]AYA02108.1 hypothetical protein BEN74_03970 [Acinetobacter sp. WCHAc010034]
MNGIPEELIDYQLYTCDYGDSRNSNYKFVGAFDSRDDALIHVEQILKIKLSHELYEFEIKKVLSESKIKAIYDELCKYRELSKS